jgi:hypothetical protein
MKEKTLIVVNFIRMPCAPYGRIKMHGSNMVVESHAIKN